MVLGMSTQIAVRLPDELVRYLDERVANGETSSRAALVAQALERERRREAAVRDARIYAEHGEDDDLAAFTRTAAAQPLELD